MSGFQLRRLRVSGLDKISAEVEFQRGLNVISGLSETGKSFVVETIDFMLGGALAPRQIPESAGYDRASLKIAVNDGRILELHRALQGGDFEVEYLDGLDAGAVRTAPSATAGEGERVTKLGARFTPRRPNISAFLLELAGLTGKVVRKNTYNETQNLSFRNLVHLVVVDEQAIMKTGSPLHTAESSTRTLENSVLKLLLTGVDDSTLIPIKRPDIAKAEHGAQENLLGDLIAEYEEDLRRQTEDADQLPAQLERLNASIRESDDALEREQTGFDEQEALRQTAWKNREAMRQRVSEIEALLERFSLLDEHYTSDRRRLEAVAEAGYFFVALQAGTCPLCGAPAGSHTHEGVPQDSDIDTLRSACEREVLKIAKLQSELVQAVADLRSEQVTLAREINEETQKYRAADQLIRERLSPVLSEARSRHSKLIEKRSELRQASALADRIESLKERQQQIAAETVERATQVRLPLSAEAIQVFSRRFEELLDAWRFPHDKPVIFDAATQDFILGARRRGEQGKGMRALTHAAFSIGLLEACRSMSRPHPGFVVLDSPLVTFREADPGDVLDEDGKIEVKQCFYRDLARRIVGDQVIVVENEDPDREVGAAVTWHLFSGREKEGRYGFFPGEA